MKNNINYFTHDAYSHVHPKFKMLMVEYGWEGYGRFWALNEMIGQSEDCFLDLSQKYNKASIAADLGFSIIELEEFINFATNECNLIFETKDGKISTDRIQEVLEGVMKTRKRAKLRYEKKGSSEVTEKTEKTPKKEVIGEEIEIILEENEDILEEDIESKVNENKVNEKKSKIEILEESFIKFRDLYPRKESKRKAEIGFMQLNLKALDNLFIGLDLYINKWKVEETQRCFIPIPTTWLNQERRNDEVVIADTPDKPNPVKREVIKAKARNDHDKVVKKSEEGQRIKNEITDIIKNLPLDKQKQLDEIVLANVLKMKPSMKGKEDTPFIKPMLLAEKHRFIREKYKIK